jgi:ribose transport system substrate-binding protein
VKRAELVQAAAVAAAGAAFAGTSTLAVTQAAFAQSGKKINIGFSAPGANHGWLAAITKNAKAQAAKYPDVELALTEGNSTSAEQIGQIETLINRKVDVLVILPQEGQALTAVATKAMRAGIPVVNLDRIFSSPLAYRTWIGGDNYGMGVSAGNYIGQTLKAGKVVEIAGLDSLELTKQRSAGFADALKGYPGITLVARQAADFTPDTGERVMANVLQAQPHIDAVWNHDDDQGIGVEAAIRNAHRSEFFMVGGAGSKHAMDVIRAGGIIKATVLYSPSMSASAVNLARLIGLGRGLSETVEKAVPSSITLYSAVVTKENVARYADVGF